MPSERKSMEDIHGLGRRYKELPDPPHNLSAEAAVLGAILFDNHAFERTQEILRHDDFYAPAHQELYRTMEARLLAGQVADAITLREHFETEGTLTQIGGREYLENLLDSAAFGPEIDDYARIIRHDAARRAVMEAGAFMFDNAADPNESRQITDLLGTVRERLQSVEDMRLRGSQWVSAQTAMQSTFTQMEHMVMNGKPGQVMGLTTGIPDLDEKLQGLVADRLIILAGRPGMGKSGAVANIATHVAMTPHKDPEAPGPATNVVGFYSLEMSKDDYCRRMASSLTAKKQFGRVEYQDAGRGRLGQSELATLAQGGKAAPETLFIDETPALSVADIAVRSRALKRSAGRLDLIVIDYLQIMNFQIGKNENLSAAIGRTTSALKQLAKEMHVPIIALSQLSRAVEQRDNKRPMISDLRESGAIEQDADQIIFPFRPEYYLNKEEPPHGAKGSKEEQRWIEWWSAASAAKGVMEFNIAKNRHGAEGRVLAHYDAGTDALVPHKDDLEIKEGRFA